MSFLFNGKEAESMYHLLEKMEKPDILRNLIILIDKLSVANYVILLQRGVSKAEALTIIDSSIFNYMESVKDFLGGEISEDELARSHELFDKEYLSHTPWSDLSDLKSLIRDVEKGDKK